MLQSALAALLLASCSNADDGPLGVAWMGDAESMFAGGVRMSSGAQHLNAATASGLVALDAQGEVIPALAERWIVTDDGRSFIFRLREGAWPGESAMESVGVRDALKRTIAGLEGTSLGLDLAPVTDVRAMAGRVVEIRLSSPVPDFLALLAQPELALRLPDGSSGPMTLERSAAHALLQMMPPQERGLPEYEGWERDVRAVDLVAAPPARALELFDEGEVQVVLGGGIGHLMLVDTGPLARGTIRLDPVTGLFGLQVRTSRGLLAEPQLREALAMALDREALVARYNVGGWVATTRIVTPDLAGDPGLVAERWQDVSLDALRNEAASRIRSWRAANGGDAPVLRLALGQGPGDAQLLRDLAQQWATIGVRLERADDPAEADLQLVDTIARYNDPRWFLNQFHCTLRRGLCHAPTDRLIAEAQRTADQTIRDALLAEAEMELIAANVFLPIGAPLRWSLVRGSVDGFAPNARGFHPLPSLAEIPR